jgi:hypothetical protein
VLAGLLGQVVIPADGLPGGWRHDVALKGIHHGQDASRVYHFVDLTILCCLESFLSRRHEPSLPAECLSGLQTWDAATSTPRYANDGPESRSNRSTTIHATTSTTARCYARCWYYAEWRGLSRWARWSRRSGRSTGSYEDATWYADADAGDEHEYGDGNGNVTGPRGTKFASAADASWASTTAAVQAAKEAWGESSFFRGT